MDDNDNDNTSTKVPRGRPLLSQENHRFEVSKAVKTGYHAFANRRSYAKNKEDPEWLAHYRAVRRPANLAYYHRNKKLKRDQQLQETQLGKEQLTKDQNTNDQSE